VRKIGGGDTDWLSQVSVTVGGKTAKGNLFMDDGNQTESIEVWGKYSVGRISREEAEAYLRGGSDGNWLVREGTGNQVVFSARKGSTFTHQLVRLIGGAGLDRKKLLTKDKLPEPVKAPPQEPKNPPPQSQPVPKLSRTVSSGSSESESEDNWVPPSGPTKPVSGGNMMGEINRLNKKTRVSARRPELTKNKKTSTTSTSPKTTTRPNESTESESETGQSKGLEPKQLETLTSSPAYHGAIDRSTAEKRLGIKPGAWLLRMGSGKQPVYSEITKEGKFNHVQIDDLTKFQGVSRVMTSRATEAVRP
jgi:hypothetical protein